MNTNSNKYIFVYATVLVVVVAVVLAYVATLLKPVQEQNIRIEKMASILKAALPADKAATITAANAEEAYLKYVTTEYVVSDKGAVLNSYNVADKSDPATRGFNVDVKSQLQLQQEGGEAGFPLFVLLIENKTSYVVPVYGSGLWGPIWGYMAFDSDCNTIKGVIFDHAKETPGLGAEITSKAFQAEFKGKKIFDQNGVFVSIIVEKGGIFKLPKAKQESAVDAISGSTITSNGVEAMLSTCLANYVAYFQNDNKEK